jgi:hypothetical protein
VAAARQTAALAVQALTSHSSRRLGVWRVSALGLQSCGYTAMTSRPPRIKPMCGSAVGRIVAVLMLGEWVRASGGCAFAAIVRWLGQSGSNRRPTD